MKHIQTHRFDPAILYVNDEGRVACGAHVGTEATFSPWQWSEIGRAPEAVITGLDGQRLRCESPNCRSGIVRLHERVGTVIGIRSGYPIIEFDEPSRCCGLPECRNTRPVASSETIMQQPNLKVGDRVRTHWITGSRFGGLVAEKI